MVRRIAGQKIALRKAEAGDGIPIRCHQVRRLLKELHLYPTAGLTPVVEPQFVVATVDCGNRKTPFQRCNQTAEAVRLPTRPPDLQRTMSGEHRTRYIERDVVEFRVTRIGRRPIAIG